VAASRAAKYGFAVKRASLLLRWLLIFGGLGTAAPVIACAGSKADNGGPTPSAEAGVVDRGRLAAPLHPAASCPVTIDTPELFGGVHVPEGTPIAYASNPPSSGKHYPAWANFQEFNVPFDDGYLVHSLEHGAIALLYKCDPAAPACASTIEALRRIRDAVPTDPACDPTIRARVIIAPYPKLDVPVAAVSWGWTYKADCVDAPTLTQFAKDHYNRGTEDICAAGRTF